MEYAKLSNGLKMPYVGLGTFPLNGEKLTDTIRLACGLGYQLFDTAGAYENESVLGDALHRYSHDREELFISSKVNWLQLKGRRRYLYLNRETVKSAYRHSCERLGVDQLDLFLLHQPFEGYCEAYLELMHLYDAQKVRAIGVCNCDIDELKKLHTRCGVWPMVNQTEISPVNTFKDIIFFCQDNDIQVEAYSPFGRGNIVSELVNNPILKEIALTHNRTVGQIVLRWIVQQGIVVIPRSTNEQRLKDNMDVFDFNLDDSEMSSIDSMNENRVYGVNQINKYDK